ncbi:YggS family pyridoxal phosphate-dependent enzyme [Orenia marismortui]|uniref:YggS family pyridoxal phosphate-dependent enzyme n=1 Tax=Orenia marismortui TaxID=46469 RepID=UPI00036DA7E5|nr:YggS family pyridoxal phosphate-dependent enzyme [Orenia marismortui]
MQDIQSRLHKIEERIEKAAKRAGRNISEIKLLPISKYHSLEKMKVILDDGINDFGESRVQELTDKYDEFDSEVRWHMIGHLQRNKVKYLARRHRCTLIHSVDSLRLAKEINKRSKQEDRVMNILIQVNTAEDDNKFGIYSKEAIELIKNISKLEYVKIKGLMTIAPYSDDPEEVRPYFRKLKELALKIEAIGIENVEMDELSMGMTNDLEVAIEEGATILRVGSGIFGEREYK